MSFLIDKKLEHERGCEAEIRNGNPRKARFHAAKAAEFAYALAEQTEGDVAKRYIEDAEGWLEIAERVEELPKKTSAGKGGGAPGKKAVADDRDNASPEDDWLVTEKPNVTFDMIAGMEDAKETIREMVVYPLKDPEKTRSLKLQAGGGVLLFGPPGTGKTTLGKAVAHELDAPFYYASGAQIRSKWHGESEQRLRSLIQAARSNPLAVLFFDDVDGLLPRRGGNSVVDNRIVVQFLSDIGGFDDSENILLLMGATNHPWDIDDAVFRTKRFDEKIFIGLPDPPARQGILAMHLDGVNLDPAFTVDSLADRLDGYTGSDIVGIVNAAKRTCLRRAVRDNTDPIIALSDFEDAFTTIPSSVNPKLMARYKKFMDQRF